jgi:hypothetical protein
MGALMARISDRIGEVESTGDRMRRRELIA